MMRGEDFTIRLTAALARREQLRLREPVTLDISKKDQIVILGLNGSGKSLLADLIRGALPPLQDGSVQYDFSPSPYPEAYRNIQFVAFRDTLGAQDANHYYQQRWNATEQDDFPLVGEILDREQDSPLRARLFELFQITPMLSKRILALSSGEMRKLYLCRSMLRMPRVVILDNPFIGLDAQTRESLSGLMAQLTLEMGIQFILIQGILDEIPSFITHVVEVEDLKVREKVTRKAYLEALPGWMARQKSLLEPRLCQLEQEIRDLPSSPAKQDDTEEVIRLRNVSIRYEEHVLLKDLSWTVRRGEKWALSGRNGSGKSTLLSLVCADNPQAYACDIDLFGHKRGSGESIWEIKRHIGYVSPEMHRSYLKNLPAIEIVASGLFDSVGLYLKPRQDQLPQCRFWMRVFGVDHLEQCPFLNLSSGQQRLVLLARAFVKDPDLLILDEPLHGLDSVNRFRVRRIIDTFAAREGKTLVMVTHYLRELPGVIDRHLELQKPE